MSATITAGPESIEVATPKRLFQLKAHNGVEVTRDGTRVLVLESIGPPPAVVLVQGWQK